MKGKNNIGVNKSRKKLFGMCLPEFLSFFCGYSSGHLVNWGPLENMLFWKCNLSYFLVNSSYSFMEKQELEGKCRLLFKEEVKDHIA